MRSCGIIDGMTTPPKVRVCLMLDADAAAELLELAGGHVRKRGDVVSELIKQRVSFPPYPPAGWLDMTADMIAAWRRWQYKQGQQ
jgi:hypothetical protein